MDSSTPSPDIDVIDFAMTIYEDEIKKQLENSIGNAIDNVRSVVDDKVKPFLRMCIDNQMKREAVDKFLRLFKDSEDKQKYEDLYDFAREFDNRLFNILSLNPQENKDKDWKKIVKTYLKDFLKINLSRSAILRGFDELKTLPKPTTEKIEKMIQNEGNQRAMHVMLDELHKFHNHWYIHLLAVLKRDNFELAHILEERLSSLEPPDDVELTHLVDQISVIVIEQQEEETLTQTIGDITLGAVGGQEVSPSEEATTSGGIPNLLLLHEEDTKSGAAETLGPRAPPDGLDFDSSTPETRRPVAGTNVDFELRSYQKELAAPGLAGKNCIIFAPTGSGKTHVAMKIAMEHLKAGENRKVAFLVPNKPLADQQTNQFSTYMGSRFNIRDLIGGENPNITVPLPEMLNYSDVIIMTAQILVNSLKSTSSNNMLESIRKFTLIIFDECHHCDKNHPYHDIMLAYFDEREAGHRNLPQIVGLTASLGTNKASETKKALEHILDMCSNLDANVLKSVRQELADLYNQNQLPQDEIRLCNAKFPDNAGNCLERLMSLCEQKVGEILGYDVTPPGKRGSPKYVSFVNADLKKILVGLHDRPKARVDLNCCINCLDIYNRALIMGSLIRSKDAKEYIERELWNEDYKMSCPTEMKMKEEYEKIRTTGFEGEETNPALEELKQTVKNQLSVKPNSRMIIFVKERAYAIALREWFEETLPEVNADIVVGATVSAQVGGQTQNVQQAVLIKFRSGIVKAVICTSVLEEGLDVPECNLVIRYGYVTNETAMVQSKGRGRAQDAKYIVIVPRGEEWLAEKEKVNKLRNQMMQEAADIITNMSTSDFMKEMTHRQSLALKQRQIKQKCVEAKASLKHGKRYQLECTSCGKEACLSNTIRVAEGSHHVVISDTIIERLSIKKMDNPKTFTTTKISGQIICANCQKPWGSLIYYRDVAFPNLAIANFTLINVDNKKDMVRKKKWKDSPFNVKEIEIDEIMDTVDRRGNAWVHERTINA